MELCFEVRGVDTLKLVEMPGVEPGSENKTIKTPTFLFSV